MRIIDNRLIIEPGIRYISDCKDYSLRNFNFPHILDKKIPGCGFTEYCLTCNIPIILCSPRIMLIKNKVDQHGDTVFWFRNELLDNETDTGKDLTKIDKAALYRVDKKVDTKSEEYKKSIQDTYNRLEEYLFRCTMKQITPKIIVTYDSFRLLKDKLLKLDKFKYFYTVVDEFQSIFVDSKFKSTTELEFVYQLKDIQSLCYVSATPMIDIYLKELDEFKDLPYFEIDWETNDPFRVVRPDLKSNKIRSVTEKAKEIIKEYKNENFEELSYKDKEGNIQTIQSTEAVFYVNSVANILNIIKKCNLSPEECNILCSDTPENLAKVQKSLGKEFGIGKIPLKGEHHKMFTFCTRTVYLGADFYSTCARSFILSDANVETLCVDISLDLPQILGRQRLLENPWRNKANFYYKTLSKDKILDKEAFDKIIEKKKKKTENLLNSYKDTREEAKHDLAEAYKDLAKSLNYKKDYVAVNEHAGKDLVPVLNKLVLIAEQRSFDIQQFDYKDRFTVFNTISTSSLLDTSTRNNISNFLSVFNNDCKTIHDKLEMLCTVDLTDTERSFILDQIPVRYKTYYSSIGPERCRALSYDTSKIDRYLSDLKFDVAKLKEEIYRLFEIGKRYTKSFIKASLSDLYSSLGYNKTPKANDLEEYFKIQECKISNKETGKRDKGFEIINKKD